MVTARPIVSNQSMKTNPIRLPVYQDPVIASVEPRSVLQGDLITLQIANVFSAHVRRVLVATSECSIVSRPSDNTIVCRVPVDPRATYARLGVTIENIIGRQSVSEMLLDVSPTTNSVQLEWPRSLVHSVRGERSPGVHTALQVEWTLSEPSLIPNADAFVVMLSSHSESLEQIIQRSRASIDSGTFQEWTSRSVQGLNHTIARIVPKSLCQGQDTLVC
jgi:hypothetical protein